MRTAKTNARVIIKSLKIGSWLPGCLSLTLLLVLLVNSWRHDLPEAEAQISPMSRARAIYESNCAVCHGTHGDGNGPAASMFLIRPRDFRSGIFKLHTTPSGSLPTDDDILWAITNGLRWTGMIGRPDLSMADRKDLVRYIKTFSPRFAAEKPQAPVVVPPAPPKTAERIAVGKRLYVDAGCDSCHGQSGAGDGPATEGLKDEWGWPTRASDLRWRPLKRGSSVEQLYITLATGFSGTPMPSYGDSLNGDQLWSLVYYLESLVPPGQYLEPRQFLGE
ncbi:MAG: c-type cytochrome, partial [Deltaproteobacteria bacterium]|nr:c-type cytochrome [Deltaproteobacteria bacterium]